MKQLNGNSSVSLMEGIGKAIVGLFRYTIGLVVALAIDIVLLVALFIDGEQKEFGRMSAVLALLRK